MHKPDPTTPSLLRTATGNINRAWTVAAVAAVILLALAIGGLVT